MVSVRPSVGQDPDLDQVVGQDRLPGPDACSVQAIEAGAVPAVAALEAADPAFAAGAPLDRLAEGRSVFGGLSGPAGAALARDDHGSDTQLVQVVFDAGLAVAAVGGDGARAATGAGDDPCDGGSQLRCVRRIAPVDGVVEHHTVGVVHHLGLVAELDGTTQPSLGDRPGVGIVQADPAGRAVGSDPGQALA